MEEKKLKEVVHKIALEVERDFEMGGLTGGIYEDFALEVVRRFEIGGLDRAREEGYQKGWEDGSKGKVFEKIEVETEVTFKDLKDVIEGKEDAGEFLSKLTTK